MPPSLKKLRPKKILIRSTNWIGDAVMTLPAFGTVRRNFPDATISVLVKPWVADVFAASRLVDEIVIYDKKGVHKGVRGLFRLGRELRARHFDMALLFQNAFEAALIARLASIPVIAGYARDGRSPLLTHRVKIRPDSKTKHQVHYYQQLLVDLGLERAEDTLLLELSRETEKRATEYADALPQPLLGLNPGAAYGPAKRWPAERFGELAARMQHAFGGSILVFGTEADRDVARQIKEMSPSVIDLAGKTTLAEAMGLIRQCRVFVTNDSGLMHVAAALQTPLVAIFGSTDRVATGPFSHGAVALQKDLPCIPCLKTHCSTHFRCMLDMSVDDVFGAVDTLLKGSR